jgi:hypothetical protein
MVLEMLKVLAAMAISPSFKFELGKLLRVRAIQGEYLVAIKASEGPSIVGSWPTWV